jgi:hypothetical protein
MHYKKFIQQWKYKLKDAQLFVEGNLPNQASKIKRLQLPVMIFTCTGHVLNYTSITYWKHNDITYISGNVASLTY